MSTRFKNKAGEHTDTDDVLTAELTAAGITVMSHKIFLVSSGEVKSSVIGELFGWTFKRAWTYWIATGPGIDLVSAERLHLAHGRTVRVDGHCGCPSPGEWFKGLACGSYHVDDQEGLNALADTIRGLVAAYDQLKAEREKTLLDLQERLSRINELIPDADEINDTHIEDVQRLEQIRKLSTL